MSPLAIKDPPTLILFGVGAVISMLAFAAVVISLDSSGPDVALPAQSSSPRRTLGTDIGPVPDLAPASPETPATPPVEPGAPTPEPADPPSWTPPGWTPPRAPIVTTAPTAASTITGRYRVMDSYGDSFIGEVLIINAAGHEQNWTARLVLPDNIGAMRTFWVESAPQATLKRSGQVLVFTSGAPVPARSSVPLRFHLDRTGTRSTPSACTVNNAPCSGL